MKASTKNRLVSLIVEDIYRAYPDLVERFGENGRERTYEDNYHHLDHLETAFQMDNVTFFLDYTMWLNNVLTSRGVGTELIIDNYQRLIQILDDCEMEEEAEKQAYIEYLKQGITVLS
ncbi:hypothetical protein [Thalassobacillus hwangdonensis]|uniref:Uncharacterized protein n=1 Tax=Thalassobacillus hwangdonensis TaxID=546108 RepID=A0ABW3L3T5_9BACI